MPCSNFQSRVWLAAGHAWAWGWGSGGHAKVPENFPLEPRSISDALATVDSRHGDRDVRSGSVRVRGRFSAIFVLMLCFSLSRVFLCAECSQPYFRRLLSYG